MYYYNPMNHSSKPRFDSEHPQYREYLDLWEKCRDCYRGEESVKNKSQKYLPYLSMQDSGDYHNYRSRAIFLNVVRRTIHGLVGASLRKSPIIKVPRKMEEYLLNIDLNGLSFMELLQALMTELLVTGRVNVVVDRDEDSRCYLTYYTAESGLNWRMSKNAPVMAAFAEQVNFTDDGFDHILKDQYRVYDYNEDGYLRVRVAMESLPSENEEKEENENNFEVIYETIPTIRGEGMQDFPVFCFNAAGMGLDNLCPPPLLDLSNISLSHYRTSADLENGRHFTSLPQPWITGVDADEFRGGLHIGGNTAWIIPNENARLGYLEFNGAGLGSLENALREKEAMMAVVGARLLDTKKGVESAETSRIRQNIETSVLSHIVVTLENGLKKVLQYMARWEGFNESDVHLELNMDFIDVRIPHQEIISLVQAYQMGGISMDTLLYNLKSGEVIPDDVSIEDEREKIEMDHGPKPTAEQDRSIVLQESESEKLRKELSPSGRGD